MARGTSRRGLRASSPSVAAASKPAKDRKPKTTPRNSAEVSVPAGTVNTDRSNVRPPGAVPPSSRTSTTTVTSRMSSTVTPSTTSSNRVPRRAGDTASRSTPTSATASSGNGAQSGASGQIPTWVRKAAPKIPAAAEVTTP